MHTGRESVELVVTNQGDGIGGEHHVPHDVQGLSDLKIAVYKIAHKGHLPFIGVQIQGKVSYISEVGKQYFKYIRMPMHIAKHRHADDLSNELPWKRIFEFDLVWQKRDFDFSKLARMEVTDHCIFIHVLPDKHELIESVAEVFVPSAFDVVFVVNKRAVADALAIGHGSPPYTGFVEARGTAGLAEVHRIIWARGQPEQALRADHTGGIVVVEVAPEPLGMKGLVTPEHK